MLVSKIERTEIESKSQLNYTDSPRDTVGIKDRKNWNWKQITTKEGWDARRVPLVSKIERTEIESKSQLTLKTNVKWRVGIKDRKNWNWKQITTTAEGHASCRCWYQR